MRVLETDRLRLEPLTVSHAEAMFEVLADPLIYRYLDRPPPPSLAHLRQTYARQEKRRSPDGAQIWLNWVIRLRPEPLMGYVQATIVAPRTAWVAYVLRSEYWGHGYATEAVEAVLLELSAAYGVNRYLATVEGENQRSIRLLERLGFRRGVGEDLAGHDLSPTEWLFVL